MKLLQKKSVVCGWGLEKGSGMRLDIYRRVERCGDLSYLAVPEGHVIPDEVVNIDWQVDTHAVNLDDNADELTDFSIQHPIQQIREKGYAITSLKNIELGESGRMARRPE